MRPRLLDLGPDTLAEYLGGPGRARAVFRSLSCGRDPFHDADLADGLRRRLREAVAPIPIPIRNIRRARDGTTKLLLGLPGGGSVETVLIPEKSRTTLCVSSQVGCVRGCRFCLTATMGLERNLEVAEIMAQVLVGLEQAAALELPPLRNLVFMGMGEPLDNWAAVRRALDTLVDGRGFGFGPRHVTVSTVGPSPRAIERLAHCPTRIAWSLHAARDGVRRSLVASQRASVHALREAFKHLFESRKDPLFVEITLMDGVNDTLEDARAALELFRDFPSEVRFNLLPMNPTDRGYRPSAPRAVALFLDTLRDGGHFALTRTPRGQDASAACGQLAVLGELSSGSPSGPITTQSVRRPGG